jgi:hypothetical protein
MSPDFMSKYLALGPLRMRVSKQTEKTLPAVLELSITGSLAPELLEKAKYVREQYKGLPERVIRRKVRDALDIAKARGDCRRRLTGHREAACPSESGLSRRHSALST